MRWFGRPWPVFLIAIEKGISTLAIWAGAWFAFVLRGHPYENPVDVLFRGHLTYGEHYGPRRTFVLWLASHVPYLSSNQAVALGVALIFWGGLFAAETIGVWIEAAWGELLVIAETAAFLPFSIWNAAHHPRPLQFIAIPLNLLILGYLVNRYTKRRQAAVAR